MVAPSPETIGPQLHHEMSDWIVAATRFLVDTENALLVRRWNRDLDALTQADAGYASVLRAKYAEARGNIDEFDHWIQNAIKLNQPRSVIAEYRLVAYTNLGYATKALQVYRNDVDIKYGNIGRTIRMASSVGAFRELMRLLTQAQKGKVDLANALLPSTDEEVARIMHDRGVSDDTCAAVIDVAGEVLRSHGLFWLGHSPDFVTDADSRCVLVRFRVDVKPDEASAMTLEAVSSLIARDLDVAPLMINFMGVR